MIVFTIMIYSILIMILKEISKWILLKFLIPKELNRFNRVKNYVPTLLSYLVVGVLIGNEYTSMTIISTIVIIELIRFMVGVLSYGYLNIDDDGKIYFKNKVLPLTHLNAHVIYSINPKVFVLESVPDNELSFSNLIIDISINSRMYSYVAGDFLKGLNVTNKIKENLNLKYIYKNNCVEQPLELLTLLANDIKKQSCFFAEKNNSNTKEILSRYKTLLTDIANKFEMSENEIDEIEKILD